MDPPLICILSIVMTAQNSNTKVLLRERKRHTACRVASTRHASLSGGCGKEGSPSFPARGEGYPILT